jgi:hypothetical protein
VGSGPVLSVLDVTVVSNSDDERRVDETSPGGAMSVHIDCDTCVVRGLACHDCVVTVLLGPPPEVGFDDEEARALDVLAGSGLVPPLRMVAPQDGPDVASA